MMYYAPVPLARQTGLRAERSYRGDEVADRVTRFLPMVRRLAWHLSGSASGALDVDDLMQAGLVALTECAQKHAGPSEDGFAAYAKLRVRGAMVDLLRSCSAEPRGHRARRLRLERTTARLHGQLGREPDLAELAKALGLSAEETQRLRDDAGPISVGSIDENYSDADIRFAAEDESAEQALLAQEDREQLVAAIAGLPERLQLVVKLYFVEELNLSEIAAVLEVSVPRVHQLKANALKQLGSALRAGS
ncbi:sigma-70 family RNA polymerase sigma factor [Croceibacterium ferulae]|uniref:sigma-70 family RNA polymerase sigma factor n=1 Tax=Croceibacterium ferulae TaxID=1854641 RepID=UPI001F4EE649|nr:sigma-70 family RNA polymerase sigma factor [Croceibacterium ferulae]